MAKNNTKPKDNRQSFTKFNSTRHKSSNKTENSKAKNADKQKNDDSNAGDNKKINYVLHPRLLKKKILDAKEKEQNERKKSFELKKRKRNAIFMKKTDKGQPKLNARMKVLYDQIARSCEKT